MHRPIMLICTSLACVLAGCNQGYESTAEISINSQPSQTQHESNDNANRAVNVGSKIAIGTKLGDALATLDSSGATNESVWQWAGSDDDVNVKWRDISKGITLAIHFKKSTKKITALQMMYIPPEYNSRGNYHIVDVLSMEFHKNETYTVHFAKP